MLGKINCPISPVCIHDWGDSQLVSTFLLPFDGESIGKRSNAQAVQQRCVDAYVSVNASANASVCIYGRVCEHLVTLHAFTDTSVNADEVDADTSVNTPPVFYSASVVVRKCLHPHVSHLQ